MSDPLPFISIIIPTKPGQAVIKAVDSARELDYPADRLEIIVARGKQPSVQRNTALRRAKGEWIYFLDDDSVPPPGNLKRALNHIQRPEVMMLGGPNVCPPDAPPLEQVFAVVLGSWLAFGPSRARYTPVGRTRDASEKELILCNLMARREALLELGGFNEALYPNEENALMDELQKRGGKLVYDPEFLVHRRPRQTLEAFRRMLMTYGRGRAEQFRLHPTFGSALNFVPPLFCLYLFAFLVLKLIPAGGPMIPVKFWSGVPLALYTLIVIAQTLSSMSSHGFRRSLMAMPLLVASHLYYGLGFWRGLFTRLHRPDDPDRPRFEVVLENVEPGVG